MKEASGIRGDGRKVDGDGSPLSDQSLLDLLDALVEKRGRVAAAQALGVNYRTLSNCCDSRRVSRRMREALEEFRDNAVEDGAGEGVDGDGVGTERQAEALEQRVRALEGEGRELRELVEAQTNQLEELKRRVANLEGQKQGSGVDEAVRDEDGQQREGRPPRRGPSITTTDSQIWCLILRIRPRASHRGTLMPVRFRPKLVAKITLSDKPSL